MDHPDLPDELKTGGGKVRPISDEQREQRLFQLGQIVAKKREEAVKARKDSGIEDVWRKCEESYLGIDDMTRGEFEKARWAKPTSPAGPVTTNDTTKNDTRSRVFLKLTTRYVDMGAAKLSEIVLPIDDMPFAFGPTPVPELTMAMEDRTPVVGQDGQPIWREATDDDMAQMGAVGSMLEGPMQVPTTVSDVARKTMQQAQESAEKAGKRIYDWWVESKQPAHVRRMIHDAARLGTGIIKGPFPDVREKKAFSITDGVGVLEIVKKIAPSMKRIDPWNFFPAGNCGENIHDGDHCFELDQMSPARLRALKDVKGLPTERHPDGEPIYIGSQIDKVLEEGPDKENMENGMLSQARMSENKGKGGPFKIWHFTGTLNRDDMIVLNAPGAEDLPDDMVNCFCILTMVNDRIIRVSWNPLQKSGNMGYRVFNWSPRAGFWAGVGVAEQVDWPQRIANGGVRSWMNNAGKSSGSQIVMDQRQVVAADGSPDIVPDKLWLLTDDATADDIRKVFATYDIPDRGESLSRIIDFAFKLSEELTHIPLVSQGQNDPNGPQTFGQAELQNSNSNTLLRQLAYALDDSVTEPMVQDFYEYLLLDPDVPAEEKGDFEINARGSVAMVEKAIQETTMMMMGAMVLDPRYRIDPAKWAKETLKAKRMDPERFLYTDEEWQQVQQAMQQPTAPAVQAAQIRAESAERIAAVREQTNQVRLKKDLDRDTAYNNSLSRRDQANHEARMAELAQTRELTLLKYATDRGITLDEAKTKLADTAMKLRAQLRMAFGNPAGSSQVTTPPMEPPGRAAPGHAFEQ